jgi:hypothetical protein
VGNIAEHNLIGPVYNDWFCNFARLAWLDHTGLFCPCVRMCAGKIGRELAFVRLVRRDHENSAIFYPRHRNVGHRSVVVWYSITSEQLYHFIVYTVGSIDVLAMCEQYSKSVRILDPGLALLVCVCIESVNSSA